MHVSSFSKNLLAVLIGIFLIVLLDLALGLFGVTPLSNQDSLVGFSGSSPLFIERQTTTEGVVFERNPAKEKYFNPQTFLMPKPATAFRVVSFGGSTTYGRPYLDQTSFSHWFKQLLSRYGENPYIESINVGGISYASYRVRRVMAEMVQYQPDLFIVYSGHNEFLEARTFASQKQQEGVVSAARSFLHHSRLYSALKRGIDALDTGTKQTGHRMPGDEVSVRLEQVGGAELYHRDASFRSEVIDQYRGSINAMVDLAHEHGISLILCTLPSNLSGMSPFKSEHRSGLTEAEWEAWQTAYDEGLRALDEQNWTLALDAFLRAEQIDAVYAELHYFKGQALEQLGRYDEGYRAYVRAKQEDIVPLRALDDFNLILRQIAQDRQIPLADVDRFMRRVSPGGIPGNNLFVDHVHPSIEGQQLIAWVVLEAAIRNGLVPLQESEWQTNVSDAREWLREADRNISPRYRAMGVWGVGRLFFWAGKSNEAYVALLDAWQSVKDVPEIPRKLGLLELERGDARAALEYFAVAEQLEPEHPWALLGMAQAYNQLEAPEQALATLIRLPADRDDDPGYHLTRGQALVALNRVDEGLSALQTAVSLAPDVPRFEYALAYALGETGDPVGAERHFQKYLSLRHLPESREIKEDWLRQFKTQPRQDDNERTH